MGSRRKRRLSIAGIVLVLLASAGAWAMTREPGEMQHDAARSFRKLVGAPEPPPEPGEYDYGEELPRVGEQASTARVVIPDVKAKPPPPAPVRPPDLKGVSFVLLLGSDNRTDKVVGRTDSMIVIAFRDRDGKVAAFSIPRDLWVELPDVGTLREQGRDHARVSSIVRVGEVRIGEGAGIPLLRQTLREQLGIRIDRYASVDFRGFVALVDEIGGVDVEVQCPIMDCFWTQGTDAPCEMMSIEAGLNHMDGGTSLLFVRSRHGTGDRDRTRRQQALLLAFGTKVRARGLRGVPRLWRTAAPFVTTDLDRDDAAYYASFAVENDASDVHGFSIRHPMTTKHVTADDKHVLLLDRSEFDAALGRMFSRELPALTQRRRCPEPDAALTR